MVNPYQTTAPGLTFSSKRPKIRLKIIVMAMISVGGTACGLVAGIPAAILLNQEWRIVPTRDRLSDIHIGDQPVSDAAVIGYSMAIAGPILVLALVFGLLSVRSWYLHRRPDHLIGYARTNTRDGAC